MLIAIAGGSASGKSTVAQKIVNILGDENAIILRMDDYYNDLSHLPPEARAQVNFDHPESIDLTLLKEHLSQLKNGLAINKPVYNFQTHAREVKTQELLPKQMIIIEGLFTLVDNEICQLCDIKIYIDATDEIRLKRRIKRDVKERGRTPETVKKQYLETVKPMHDQFIEPSKFHADMIIDGNNYNEEEIEKIIEKLNLKLKEPKNS